MKKKLLLSSAFMLIIVLFGCKPSEEKETGLDINEYLALTEGKNIYPTDRQIKMILPLLPEDSYMPAPAAKDRTYWEKIAQSEDGQKYYEEALELIGEKPEVPISDEIYRRANKEGNRGIYKPRYYRTMDRLERYTLAECMENKGRFIPQIETYCKAVMSMKSWMHPNHDDSENSVLEGKRVAIDLGARKFGMVLSLADVLLEDKLSEPLRKEIHSQLDRRITQSYFDSTLGIDTIGNSWIRKLSNWNAVCTSGSLFTILTQADSKEDRAAAIGCAINSMKYYLSGFGEDGYCSEGVGYWGYGFGHYLYLAQMLSDYTDGKIDLFRFNNYEKLKKVAHFPYAFEIQDGVYPQFSDGSSSISAESDNLAALMAAKHYDAPKPLCFVSEEAVGTIMGWKDAREYTSGNVQETTLPAVTYFDDYGIVISRGTTGNPFSIAIKAGHNAENHNHNDVGSYVVVWGKDIVAGDVGAPSYTAGAFSPQNPARSSWGHPVPKVNNTLQHNGRKYEGKILNTNFSEATDKVVMDLKKAYKEPLLESLVRTMEHNRNGKGEIVIQDQFTATSPIEFGTAVMVNSDYRIDGKTILLKTEDKQIKVEIQPEGGDVKLKEDPVSVKLRSGKKSHRIGIDFVKPLSKGKITVRYTLL
ncbi:hypothetical protein CE91St6_30250 [Phocaeicola dorei]|jgi:hypothetical protein|uniref:Heparinase n=1 Tax=Phocaeicola dorei TaxID=357276 RepID=A0AA37KNQ4_9BACT|nr:MULTISPECIES: heparinase II/III family protein [Bacteroidaceae]MDF0565889.1 heparinase II/III family protein [Bacteroides xylanisolvens]GKH77454.1 hypothetical protein CE91St6_30250 [Phocaeicola dorei]GKH82144.1 hypothetical protein CE91St7_30280 [Phocaeicola dorei]